MMPGKGRERLTDDSLIIQVGPSKGGQLEDLGGLAHVRERNFRRRFRAAGVGRERPRRGSDVSFAGAGASDGSR